MSRHRAVRNLDLDDEMAEDDFDSGAEDPYESITAEERAALDEAMTTLTSVLGPSPQNGFTEREMQDQLWEAYFDVDQATSALIEERSRREARDKKRADEGLDGDSEAQVDEEEESGAPLSALQRLSIQRRVAKHPSGATTAPGTRGLGGGGRAGLAKKNLASLAPPELQQPPRGSAPSSSSSRLAQLAAAKRSSSKRPADANHPGASLSSNGSTTAPRPSKLAALAASRAKAPSPIPSSTEPEVAEGAEAGKPLSKLQQKVLAAKQKKAAQGTQISEEEMLAERAREHERLEEERQRRELLPSGDAIVSLFPSGGVGDPTAGSPFTRILQPGQEGGGEVPGGSPFDQGCEEYSRFQTVFSEPSPDDIVLKAREGTNLAART